jgi:hypothetical protein
MKPQSLTMLKSFDEYLAPEEKTDHDHCIKCSQYFNCDHKKCKFSKMHEEMHRPICTEIGHVGITCWCDCGAAKQVE